MTMLKSVLLGVLLICGMANASSTTTAIVTFEWDSNNEANIAGYKMYSSERDDGIFETIVDSEIPLSGQPTVTYQAHLIVPIGGTVYVVVTAYDNSGSESSYSNMVSYTDTNRTTCRTSTQTQTINCKPPEKGDIFQTRTSTCVNGMEVWGDWITTGSTCQRNGANK